MQKLPGDSESSKLDGAKRWRANQRLLLCERAGVWVSELSRAEGHRGNERLAAKWGVCGGHRNTPRCLWVHPGTHGQP